jgi:hypothetical protein
MLNYILIMKTTILCTSLFALLINTNQISAQIVYATQYTSEAHIKVYVTKYKSDADLVVYKSKYKSDAQDNDGIWYFTDYSSEAKKKIYFTRYVSDADLIVYFTEYKSDAGWQNRRRQQLMY